MKKFTFLVFLNLLFLNLPAQLVIYTGVPSANTNSSVRLPNGTSSHAYVRAAHHIKMSELAVLPVNNNTISLTRLGFTTTTGPSTVITGTISIYMQNTTDPSYTLGTNWGNITAGMTLVYQGAITIPTVASTIDLTLDAPFTYTNTHSMYIAFDFVAANPTSTVAAGFAANSSVPSSGAAANSSTASPITLNSNSPRPQFRLGYANPFNNDMEVLDIFSMGKLPLVFGDGHQVKAVVRNSSNTSLNNVQVNLNITGFNTFADTKTITTLAMGANDTVTFAGFNPSAQGDNTITVSVPSDQNNINNSRIFKMQTNCNTLGLRETPFTYNSGVGFNTGSGIILTKIRPAASGTVQGANIRISNDNASVGNTVYAAITNSVGTLISTSNPVLITSGVLNTTQSFTFVSTATVNANTNYYIGLAQPANTVTGYFPLGTYPNNWIPSGLYATSFLTGGIIFNMTNNLGIMGIEAVFSSTCIGTLPVVETAAAKAIELSVYPNPASDKVNITLMNVSEDTVIELFNSLGQSVAHIGNVNYTNELDVADLPKGVYIIKVTNGNRVAAGKLVISR